jgi:hypothetical protein
MEPESPRYERPDRAAERQQRQQRRHSAVVAFAYVAVVAIILGAAFGCPRDAERAADSTTTTTAEGEETTSTTAEPGPMTFTAQLTGDEQIPPVETDASGTLTLTISEDGTTVDYVLRVEDLVGVTLARLRLGQSGETGEAIITLYDGPRDGSFTGTLAEGSFTADDLEGPLEGQTIEDLVRLILADSIYLNVGTDAHKSGEIRGQLE